MKKTTLTVFATYLLLVGLSAVAGGFGLIFMNGLGMPVASLHGAFNSYVIPGLILSIVVGGTYLEAARRVWAGVRLAPEAVATAGFGLAIWIFTELYIIHEPRWLQAVYFSFALVTLIGSLTLLKFISQDYL